MSRMNQDIWAVEIQTYGRVKDTSMDTLILFELVRRFAGATQFSQNVSMISWSQARVDLSGDGQGLSLVNRV